MECKFLHINDNITKFNFELIDTLWNVNKGVSLETKKELEN